MSAEIIDVLTGRDLIIVRDRQAQAPSLLQEGDLVIQHLHSLHGVRSQDNHPGAGLLQLRLDRGVRDGGGGVGHGQPPVNSLAPDDGLDALLSWT